MSVLSIFPPLLVMTTVNKVLPVSQHLDLDPDGRVDGDLRHLRDVPWLRPAADHLVSALGWTPS